MTMTTTTTTATVSMTSREIAELVEKRHDNVMADLRKMFKELEEDALKFEDIYLDAYGREKPMFRLDKDYTLCLLGKYSAVVRFRVIKRMNEMETALVAVTQATTLEAAHGIAEEVLARRDMLRMSYKTEVTQVLTQSFLNHTSGGGRNVSQVMMNHAKLIALIATGSTPCVFKKEHDGLAPRDYAVATNNLEMIDALSRAEAKVLALSEAGMSYSEIKALLVKE